MADPDICALYVLHHEDYSLTGITTADPSHSDPNAKQRFGVNSAAWPNAERDGFYQMPRMNALQYAEDLLKYSYFSPIDGYQIKDQTVCNKFCDLAFNAGVGQATKIIQRAVNACGGTLKVDGMPGPLTTNAINATPPLLLMQAIRDKGKDFYMEVKARNPVFKLDQLLKRLNS